MSLARAYMEALASRSRNCHTHVETIRRLMFFGGSSATFSAPIQHVSSHRHLHHRTSFLSPASSSSYQGSTSVISEHDNEPIIIPRIPLCERPPAHSAQLTSLLAWRELATQRATLAGTQWAAAGEADAPSVEDLHTELSWLLDDVVAGVRTSPSAAWQQKSWREIERVEAAAVGAASGGCGAAEIHLRESLEGLDTLWHRRVEDRVPLQYLTSCVFWRDLVLSVGPGVLIPRPETELLIDFSVAAVEANPDLGQGIWADLGTGSGALAIGLAHSIPTLSKVWAVDLAPEPAAHAAFNAERAGLEKDRLEVVRGSWYEPLIARGHVGQLAGIVSNPPYITEALMQGLQAEVGQYEPELALDGGEGLGIDCLAPICIGAVDMLQPGGFLALETAGGEQAEYIAQLLQHLRCGVRESAGEEDGTPLEEHLAFENVRIRNDLRGVDRFVTATRSKYPCTRM